MAGHPGRARGDVDRGGPGAPTIVGRVAAAAALFVLPLRSLPALAGPTTRDATGIALFPPPNTKPIKRGLIVPDDFVLPPGYVRHYQTTDDGRQLPPILMFHPDFQPVDAHGRPVPKPKDGVVPPEQAPPGFPVRMLEPQAKPGR